MKNIASLFTETQRKILKEDLDIELTDTKEYSDAELSDIYDAITDNFPAEFDEKGKPIGKTKNYEAMIDVFVKNKLINFA